MVKDAIPRCAIPPFVSRARPVEKLFAIISKLSTICRRYSASWSCLLRLLSTLVSPITDLSFNDYKEKRTLSTRSSRAASSLCSLEHTCVTLLTSLEFQADACALAFVSLGSDSHPNRPATSFAGYNMTADRSEHFVKGSFQVASWCIDDFPTCALFHALQSLPRAVPSPEEVTCPMAVFRPESIVLLLFS